MDRSLVEKFSVFEFDLEKKNCDSFWFDVVFGLCLCVRKCKSDTKHWRKNKRKVHKNK
jgi:hypothetical protein